jgi:hypothetical protein
MQLGQMQEHRRLIPSFDSNRSTSRQIQARLAYMARDLFRACRWQVPSVWGRLHIVDRAGMRKHMGRDGVALQPEVYNNVYR